MTKNFFSSTNNQKLANWMECYSNSKEIKFTDLLLPGTPDTEAHKIILNKRPLIDIFQGFTGKRYLTY